MGLALTEPKRASSSCRAGGRVKVQRQQKSKGDTEVGVRGSQNIRHVPSPHPLTPTQGSGVNV